MTDCVVCGGDYDGTRAPPEWSYEDICRACARWASSLLEMVMPDLVADRFKRTLVLDDRPVLKVTSSAIPYPYMKVD